MKWSCRIGMAAISLLFLAALEPAVAQAKRVVLLHSFGQDFKPWSEYARTIRSELQRQSPWQLDITDHTLVAARFENEDPEVPFVAYLRALFAEQQPDLIVCIGAPAAHFVQRHRPQLFANFLMLFTGVVKLGVQFFAFLPYTAVVPVGLIYLRAYENYIKCI